MRIRDKKRVWEAERERREKWAMVFDIDWEHNGY